MKKAVWSGVLAVAMMAGVVTTASAQTDTKGIAVTVNVNARAKLTLGAASVTFNDADPDVTPTFTSGAITIDVKARGASTGNILLTMAADGDLTSGTDTIAIGGLTWTSAGAGFVNGAAATTDQTVGSWAGSGSYAGSHTLSLPNSWTYAVGNYTATLTYTLSTP